MNGLVPLLVLLIFIDSFSNWQIKFYRKTKHFTEELIITAYIQTYRYTLYYQSPNLEQVK